MVDCILFRGVIWLKSNLERGFFYLIIFIIVATLAYAVTVGITGQIDFNAGTYTNTEFFNGALRINADAAGSGNYTSKVIDAISTVDWQRVYWFENNFCSQCALQNFSRNESSMFYYDSGVDMDETIVLYHLDESAADSLATNEDFYDAGGNFLHGNVTGTGLTFNNNGGVFAGAIDFDNTEGGINVGYFDFSALSDITMSAWFKTSVTSGTRRLWTKDRNGVQGNFIQFFIGTTSYFNVYDTSIGGWQQVSYDASAFLDGNWHNRVDVIDSVNNKIYTYYDGVQVGTDAFNAATLDDSDNELLALGIDSALVTQSWEGSIDEAAVWARAFTAQEVQALYNRSAAHFNVSVKARSCNDVNCAGESFTDFGVGTAPMDISTLPDNQFIQFQFNLSSNQSGYSPKITYVNLTNETNEFEINYTKGTPWTISAGSRAASETGVTAPTLDSPVNVTASTDTTPSLVWDNGNNTLGEATTYRLQVATDEAFTALVVDVADIAETNDTQTSYTTSALTEDDIYYWRVRTEINGFESDWSTVFWQFEVQIGTLLPHVGVSTEAEFDEGTYTNTEYSSNALQITSDVAGSGNYTSKVLDANASSDWQNIYWYNNEIAGLELPNLSRTDGPYYDGIDMNQTIALMHLDEAAADSLVTGEDFYDMGGNFLHANETGSGTAITYGTEGVFGTAITVDGDTNDKVATLGFINFSSVSHFTVSAWINLTLGGNRRIVAKDSSAENSCFILRTDNGDPYFYVMDSTVSTSTYRQVHSTTNVNNGVWHHMVGVVDATANLFMLYVDGVQVANASFNADFMYDLPGRDITIGGSHNNVETFGGTIDEVAMWGRVLNDTEIKELYDRGAAMNNVSIKVRSCDDDACSGESFTDFGVKNSPADISSLVDNRYVQFQLNLSSDTAGYSPKITYVNLTNETTEVVINKTKGTSWTLSDGTRASSESGVTAPTLDFPANDTSSTNTTPVLVWNNGNNTMGEASKYRLQVATDEAFTALVVNVADIVETNDTQTGYKVSALTEDDVYYWKVRTEIIGFESAWSSPYFQYEALSSTAISLPISTVSFGTVVEGNSYNSTALGVQPLVVRNDGSSLVNITVNASAFFTGTDPTYQFRVVENESGAYSSAVLIWTDLTTSTTNAITNLKSDDSQDEANIHILIGVPSDESAGDKTSNIEVST